MDYSVIHYYLLHANQKLQNKFKPQFHSLILLIQAYTFIIQEE